MVSLLSPLAKEIKLNGISDQLMSQLSRELDPPNPLDRDWRGVATELQERLKYSTDEVELMKNELARIGGSPTRALLIDAGKRGITLYDLHEILVKMDHKSAYETIDNFMAGSEDCRRKLNVKKVCLNCCPRRSIKMSEKLREIAVKFEKIAKTSSKAVCGVYLVGPPGCGKTELARQYQARWIGEKEERSDDYDAVFVTGSLLLSSAEVFSRTLLDLSQELTPAGGFDFAQCTESKHARNIQNELKKAAEWLLILDDLNYEFFEKVKTLLPFPRDTGWGNGKLLVTTCDRRLFPSGDCAEIISMPRDWTENDSVELLRRAQGECAKSVNNGILAQIAALLGYYPLSLATVVKYVEDADIEWDDSEFLEELYKGKQLAIEENLSDDDTLSSLRVTQIALNQMLYRRSDDALRASLLVFGICSLHPIPFSVFTEFFRQSNVKATKQHIASLKACSLFIFRNVARVELLSIDKTTRDAILKATSNDENLRRVAEEINLNDKSDSQAKIRILQALTECYDKADEETDEGKGTSLKLFLLPHLVHVIDEVSSESRTDVGRTLAKACVACADALDSLGRPTKEGFATVHDQIKGYLEKALAFYEDADTATVSRVNLDLAKAYDDLFETSTAIRHAKKALAGVERNPNAPPALHLQCLQTLGRFHLDVGQLEDAKQILQRGLQLSRNVDRDGKRSVQTAAMLTLLGRTYQDLGEADRGKVLLEEALEICEQNPFTFSRASHVLAQVLVALGRANLEPNFVDAALAVDLLQRALEIRVQLHSYEHPLTALTLTSLARAYLVSQKPTIARLRLEEALCIQEQVLPYDHLDKATTLNILGNVERTLGNWERAVDFLQQSLEIRLQRHPENHPDIAFVSTDLGVALVRDGKPRDALVHLERGLAIKQENFGDSHVEVAIGYACLEDAYRMLERHRDANECATRHEEIMERQTASQVSLAANEQF